MSQPMENPNHLFGLYDADYYERGRETGKSGYQDYSWERLGPYFMETARHIRERFGPSSLLDVGCAKGYLVYAMLMAGVDVRGIDASAYAVSHAPVTVADRVQVGIAQNLPFPNDRFEVVAALDVLEHIPADEVPLACRELLRVSSRWVIARVPTAHEPGDCDITHCTIRPRTWWEEQFQAAGGVVETTEAYLNPGVWWFNIADYLLVIRKP